MTHSDSRPNQDLSDELSALRAIVEGTAGHTGQKFFQSLVRHLGKERRRICNHTNRILRVISNAPPFPPHEAERLEAAAGAHSDGFHEGFPGVAGVQDHRTERLSHSSNRVGPMRGLSPGVRLWSFTSMP